MTQRKCMLWLPFMFLLGVMLASLGRISYSATITTIRVDPPMLFVEPGEHFTINITIMNAVDLFAWQVNVTFDPSVVQVVKATLPPGHFLEGRPKGTTDLMTRILDRSIGMVLSILGEYDGKSGSGTLVTIEFEVVQAGESALRIDESEPHPTILINSLGEETYPGPNLKMEHGYISNIDRPPIASFTYSPSKPSINETITFDASASYDPDGSIVRYEWDFGDGTKINETEPTTTHVYTTAKTYTVTLIVIDNATATQKIMDAFGTTTIPRLWYELYSSYSTEIKFLVTHNIVVISADASPTTVAVGEPVTISVTVENQGKETETFNVIAYYDNSTAATTTVENLASENSKTLELIWDTTNIPPQTYVIKVEANLEGDENPNDNIYLDGTVTVKPSGTSFPIEYVIIGVVGGGAIGIGVFLFARRKRTSVA